MSEKLFTKRNMIFTACGLILNALLVWVTSVTGIPLYLDSIGTVLVSALGGFLPGITVGFLSNIVTSLFSLSSDPLTLYYGIISILIALTAAAFSYRGLLRKVGTSLLLVPALTLLGGGLGSVMTWLLYGLDFGEGITAPLARLLFEKGLPTIPSLLISGLAIDCADKFITVAIVYLVLRFVPYKLISDLPNGYIYDRNNKFEYHSIRHDIIYRKHSLRTKLVMIILIVAAVFSVVAITTGVTVFRRIMVEEYSDKCENVANIVAMTVDGNKVDEYLASKEKSSDYVETESELKRIHDNTNKIKYVYVYKIENDGCHVVFDVDNGEEEGNDAGTVIPFEEPFADKVPSLLNGETIEPVISNGVYGWLITSYKQVFDSTGKCVAYACADIDMREIINEIYIFFISISSLLFGAFIVLVAFALRYCDHNILEPIGVLVKRAEEFDIGGNREQSTSVRTGDELETLYNSMCAKEKRINGYIEEVGEKNDEISKMQRNIIYSLANMTESRDKNTGNHIKRTAEYVRLIGRRLLVNGYDKQTVTDQYVQQLYESAPLHDIGKIEISDVILNKPGKLTTEEFDIMKTHTTTGADILRGSLTGISDGGSIAMAVDMAESHHERWDGNGYPHGLKGDRIPLCARIMAVSDVFDALVSKRSYKEAFSIEESMNIIILESGSHFDPDIVKAFTESPDEVARIAKL